MGVLEVSYPLISTGNVCDWIKTAHANATAVSGQYGYSGTSDNSNTFITRIIRATGGTADFPFGATGSDDID